MKGMLDTTAFARRVTNPGLACCKFCDVKFEDVASVGAVIEAVVGPDLPQPIGQHSLLWEEEKPEGMVPLMLLLRHTLQWLHAGQVELLLQVGPGSQTGL